MERGNRESHKNETILIDDNGKLVKEDEWEAATEGERERER